MRNMLLCFFAITILQIVCRVIFLLANKYPRTLTYNHGEDIVLVIVEIALFVSMIGVLWP